MFVTRLYECNDFIFEHSRQPAFAILPQCFFLYSISILVDGPSEVEVTCGEDRTRAILGRGDMIVAPYRLAIDGGHLGPCEFLQLYLNPSLVERAAAQLESKAAIVPVLGAVDPLAEHTIYQLDEALGLPGDTRAYLTLLVETLAKHLVINYSVNTWPLKRVGGFPKYLLSRTLDCADQCLEGNLSTEEVARVVGVEADRFARAFRASTGKSLHRYLNERRLEWAKSLLKDQQISIAEVAQRTGFETEERLSNVFRRRTGVTPSAYRGKDPIH